MLSVTTSCHYNGNSKIGKIPLWTNARPSGAIPTNPGQKLGCKGPRVEANVWCKSPGVPGGMVTDEIDTYITAQFMAIKCDQQITHADRMAATHDAP